jgi:uncharacterized protein (TIGR00297 family)
MQVFIGFLFAIFVSILALRAGALDRSGALAAALSGGLIFGLGGYAWAALLLTFFISSSALSKNFARRKQALSEKFAKGSRRDWGQVLANGGLGAILVIVQAALPGETWPWVAFAGAMAAVNADTWATELGVLSPGLPRLITTWRPVERGASGAVSLTGSLAALGGAALVALLAALFSINKGIGGLILASVLGGVCGSFFDSLLGATVQAIYWCPNCQKETERHPLHLCATPTVSFRGWRWLDNDWVNFISSVLGAGIAVGIWVLFF